MRYFTFLLFFISIAAFASPPVSLKDNVLLAFEKCKILSADLHKGQLIEAKAPSFDLVCKKIKENQMDFSCEYFDTGSLKKVSEEKFSGGSMLGVAELKSNKGTRISFLIGKDFASYESPSDFKICLGFYLFEQDAIKKRATR